MSAPLRARLSASTGWTMIAAGGAVSPAGMALTLYTFLILSRLPELIGFIGLFRPILVLAVISIALAATLPSSRLQMVFSAPEARAMLALFALAVASVPTSVWPGFSFRWVLFSFSKTLVFFFLILYCVRTFRDLRWLVWAFVSAHAALILGVLLLNVRARARVSGTYDPNDLAFAIVCALPVAVMLMVVVRGWRRYAIAAFVPLALVAIIMTKSRGGLIALVVVAVIVFAKFPMRNPMIPAGLALGGLLVFALFAPQSYWDRMATIGWGGDEEQVTERTRELGEDAERETATDYEEGGLRVRWRIWMTGVRMTLENPIFGVGANNFAIAEGGQTFGKGRWIAAHNSFLQIAAELGIPALAVYLYLLYRSIRNYRTVVRVARGVPKLQYHLCAAHGFEAAMYGYVVAGSALNHAYTAILYCMLAISVVLKWQTLRERARLGDTASTTQVSPSTLPWWKVRR